jgi:hypothetical protein
MDKATYLSKLESRCGKKADYFFQEQFEEGPPIGVIGFDHYPREGDYTYFTYGLHLVGREEWTHGRPEYFITIDSNERLFAIFFSYVISSFAWEKSMTWNTLLGIGNEDAVEGYPYRRLALGMPQYLNWSDYQLKDNNELPINFGMAFFISDSDFSEAAEVGFSYLEQMMEKDHDYWRKLQQA